MWWNLDIFGKFALENRMDYWYLWKIHFWNFRDFQKSPNPLKILIPTPASDFCTRCKFVVVGNQIGGQKVCTYSVLGGAPAPPRPPHVCGGGSASACVRFYAGVDAHLQIWTSKNIHDV